MACSRINLLSTQENNAIRSATLARKELRMKMGNAKGSKSLRLLPESLSRPCSPSRRRRDGPDCCHKFHFLSAIPVSSSGPPFWKTEREVTHQAGLLGWTGGGGHGDDEGATSEVVREKAGGTSPCPCPDTEG